MGLYPLMMELRGREILLVGGGHVALRKFRALSGLGARFTVISPRLLPGFEDAGEELRHLRSEFRPELLGAPFLALACTDSREGNRLVRDSCREKGVPVCVCDDPEGSDFIFPAVASRGPLTLAVSTGGASPLLAKELRDELAAGLERYVPRAEQAGEERRAQKAAGNEKNH